jgi:hypothetical protein
MKLFPTFPFLDQWYFASTANKEESAEDTNKLILVGNVYNHPGFKDGELIRTAPIKTTDLDRGLIKTSDKTYLLGMPRTMWVEWLIETKQDKEIARFLSRVELYN